MLGAAMYKGLDDPSRKVLVTHLPIYKLPTALLNVLIDLVDGIFEFFVHCIVKASL